MKCPSSSTTMTDYEPKQGDTFDTKFELLEVLGAGGVGTVFKAWQLDLERLVALKIIHQEWLRDDEMKARFLQEGILLNRLRHINIVSVYQLAISRTGLPYIVFELIEGTSLKSLLSTEQTISIERACNICVQACAALAYAHEEGIVHRDLKPENLIITSNREVELVRIIDFGLAKLVSPEPLNVRLTQTGLLVGSVNYMSPEQCQGLTTVDFRTDIYSLTCTFFEMLNGKPPFEADNPMATIYKHLNEKVPKSIQTDRRQRIQEFIETGMNKDPLLRFSSMEQMQSSCRSLLDQTQSTKEPALIASAMVVSICVCLVFCILLNHRKQHAVQTPSIQSLKKTSSVLHSISPDAELAQILREYNSSRYKTEKRNKKTDFEMLSTMSKRIDYLLGKNLSKETRFIAYLYKGLIEVEADNNFEAIKSFLLSLKYSRSRNGDVTTVSAIPYHELSKAFLEGQQLQKSEECENKALEITQRADRGDPCLEVLETPLIFSPYLPLIHQEGEYIVLAEIARNRREFLKSLVLLDKAENFALPDPTNLKVIMFSRFRTLMVMGNIEQARKVFRTYASSLEDFAFENLPELEKTMSTERQILSNAALSKNPFANTQVQRASKCEEIADSLMDMSKESFHYQENSLAEYLARRALNVLERSKLGTKRVPVITKWISELHKSDSIKTDDCASAAGDQ